ncbi:glycosyltransferase family 4 protein [Candidatus Woesebacteria bacterium]|nr:glycosyltransferase family 4 protein [Candidatus Woesebacteria bacterium]
MAKISHSKITIDLVAKTPYRESGPRGVDVYARNLYNNLSSILGHGKVTLSHDQGTSHSSSITHYTFFDPFFLTLWGKKHASKFIVTVHDLIPLVFPTKFKVGLRGRLKWIFQRYSLTKASAIVTDSLCSKTDIARLTGISTDKIYVVPLSGGHGVTTEKLVKVVRKEYKLPDRYLLYVGDINWNKNVPGLVQAFAGLDSDIHLVLVGKAFASSIATPEYQLIQEAIAKSGKADRIHILGFVPSHHLLAIYRGAHLYIQPSWYEGFGFPVLEALEQGTPVACAKTGSLPEVGGDQVHYFDPSDQKSFVKTLTLILNDDMLRQKYRESGKKWAHSFSWERVVKETHAVYEKVLD